MSSPLVRALAFSLAVSGASAITPSVLASTSEAEVEPDLDHGQRLHRQCALCHGQYSQGILGGKYPRLAGLPDYYLMKSLTDYRDGVREHAAMTVVGGLRTLSDNDLASLSAYIASIDLDAVHPLDVPTPDGSDVENGEDIYKSDCKTCHGRSAEGNKRKESPKLAGQYDGYLFRQIEKFKAGKRMHANDPEDETFVDYSDQDILDIIGFVTTIDDKSDDKN
ncbi:c-type cytochrome [Thiocapsa bogorovii]|uniref:c-type cytochrome n=1 Tax=Thiocapsa bogorovii TaxID=521689 RepID=UPI001E38C8E3|nr:c-type cytochrome [Thiocapsa bogorovii]UHD15117.1 c-type cytochrome [Thiocapsa bogorovii]